MSVFTKKAEPARRVVAIRATEEERRILMEAAKREHRSLSSFVLRTALDAAQAVVPSTARDRSTRTPETIEAALTRAQEIMSKYRKPGHSFVDEFLAEKRAEAARERY
jgi:uncharacterized protein (DUF1778 family)